MPQVNPADWSLRIHGLVENEVEITWDELLALPLEESVTTLTCVSNEVGGDLIGNALWLGYPIRELLARAKPTADADMVLSHSIDGFTASTPLEVLTDDRNAILAVGMNGEPLPAEHGFPVRMVVPGLYGYVSATKWVTELEVTRFDQARAYWTDRGWSERGPIKLESRIDVPRSGQGLKAGRCRDRRRRVAAAGRGRGRRGADRRGRVGSRDARHRDLGRHVGAVELPVDGRGGRPRDPLPRDKQGRRAADRGRGAPAPDGATGWPWRSVTVFAEPGIRLTAAAPVSRRARACSCSTAQSSSVRAHDERRRDADRLAVRVLDEHTAGEQPLGDLATGARRQGRCRRPPRARRRARR